MIPSVEVWQQAGDGAVRAGTAYFSLVRGEVSTTFSYAPSYLADPASFAIDPSLPLAAFAAHVPGLPGAFRDSSPDRWGRRLVDRRRREEALAAKEAPRGLDEVDYLLGAASLTRQGSLMYRAVGGGEFLSPSLGVPPLVQLPRLLAASRDVMRGEAGRDEVKALLDAGSSSLGGARPKASVVDGGRLLIAKFSHDGDEWDVMAWEKTALDLAEAAGIDVPARRLVSIGGQRVLLLERFDRAEGRLEGRRVPYLSAMSLLGAHDGERRDYAEVGEAMEPFVRDVSGQLEELFKRAVFSIAAHNTDDHLRNIGFLRRSGSWALSPAFDINPEPSLGHERATSVFGEVGPQEAEGAAELARALGLAPARAREAVREVLGAVGGWQRAARANGCKEAEARLFGLVFDDRRRALERAFKLG